MANYYDQRLTKICSFCHHHAEGGEWVCNDCKNKYPGFGMEWKQTGLNEITITVPKGVVVKFATASDGRKFTAEMRKRNPLPEIKARIKKVWRELK